MNKRTEAIDRKKVCFFSGDITRSGGTERVAITIANQLAGKQKWEVIFLSVVEQKEAPFFEIEDGITRYVLSDKKRWIQPGPGYLPLLPKLRRFIKEQDLDLMIDIDTILDLLTVPARVGIPVKLVAWDHFNYYYEWQSLVYRKFRRWVTRFTARHADYVVTLTERDAKNYTNVLKRKQKVYTIYNPIEHILKDTEEHVRENMLITAGRLTNVKGIDFLSRLAPKILSCHKDWKWYVLGEGEERKLLEDVRKKYSLQNQLILTGNVQNVEEYLKKASIYVMTSRAEGLPMVLLEAAGYKVPSISFDIQTGPAEIIEDGKTGFLIPPFDLEQMEEKIELLIQKDALRKKFAQQAEKSRQKFALDKIVAQWERLLEEII